MDRVTRAVADLAVLLGSKKRAAALLAQTTAAHLANASVEELRVLLPERTAKRLHAAMSFAKTAMSPPAPELLNAPVRAYAHVAPLFIGAETERMVVVCCDTRLHVRHTEVVAVGRPNVVDVRPADILVPVIRHRAVAFLIAHNHPSGDPTPSADDIALTQGVVAVSQIVGVELLDHLVVGADSFESIRDALNIRGADWGGAMRSDADG